MAAVAKFQKDDVVLMCADVEKCKREMDVSWSDDKAKQAGQLGRVTYVDVDDDEAEEVKVEFYGGFMGGPQYFVPLSLLTNVSLRQGDKVRLNKDVNDHRDTDMKDFWKDGILQYRGKKGEISAGHDSYGFATIKFGDGETFQVTPLVVTKI